MLFNLITRLNHNLHGRDFEIKVKIKILIEQFTKSQKLFVMIVIKSFHSKRFSLSCAPTKVMQTDGCSYGTLAHFEHFPCQCAILSVIGRDICATRLLIRLPNIAANNLIRLDSNGCWDITMARTQGTRIASAQPKACYTYICIYAHEFIYTQIKNINFDSKIKFDFMKMKIIWIKKTFPVLKHHPISSTFFPPSCYI